MAMKKAMKAAHTSAPDVDAAASKAMKAMKAAAAGKAMKAMKAAAAGKAKKAMKKAMKAKIWPKLPSARLASAAGRYIKAKWSTQHLEWMHPRQGELRGGSWVCRGCITGVPEEAW